MKSKLLFLVQLPPPIHGVSVCNNILANSKKILNEFDVKVISLAYSKSIAEMQTTGVLKLLKFIILFFRLLLCLVFFRPNAVYFTLSPIGASFIRDFLMVLLVKAFRIKLIYHLHGKGIAKVDNVFLVLMYKFAFKNSTIICLSEILSYDISNVKMNAKVVICANGVEDNFFDMHLDIVKNSNDVLSITFLSNLSRMKGIDVFLNAMGILVNRGWKISVNVAGPFSNVFTENDYNKILESHPNLAAKVNLHGYVDGEAKVNLLSKTNIFVHPTKHDAYPLVLLEAMSAGCIVVSSSEGGIPDMLKDVTGSIIVNEVSVEAFVRSLEMLLMLDKFNLEQRYLSSRESYLHNYTLENFESKVASILLSEVSKG